MARRLIHSLTVRAAFLVSAAITTAAGCAPAEPPAVVVAGVVTYRGTPVEYGTVNFYQKETGVSATASIAHGHYAVESPLPVGKYHAHLSVTEPDPEPGVTRKTTATPFPKRYQASTTSPLVVDVIDGVVDYPITLSD